MHSVAFALAILSSSTIVPPRSQAPATDQPEAKPVADQPLKPYQAELLDIAFRSASAFPDHPHLKNKCRNQEAVATACFDLEQPRRALGYVEKIADWRRGKGFADFAVYCARQGDPHEVQTFVDRAEEVVELTKANPDSQDWQVDRIHSTIAQAYAWSGSGMLATEVVAGVEDSEAKGFNSVQAQLLDPATLDQEIEVLEHAAKIGNFDQVASSVESCAQLFNRFYADEARRTVLEAKIKEALQKLPLQMRIETLEKLADFALRHGDRAKALSLAGDAQAELEAAPWMPEDQVALQSNIAALCFRAGDAKSAKKKADAAHELYQTSRTKITSIFRGKALRPLAEAYQTMGQKDAALKLCKQAVDESLVNPNSRPRADDLVALCCSMAVHGIEPDEGLLHQMREVSAGLKEPW